MFLFPSRPRCALPALLAALVVGVGTIAASLAPTASASAAPRHRHHRTIKKAAKSVKAVKSAKTANRRHRRAAKRVARHARVRHRDQDRIAAFVATVQPKKGPGYARRVARAIRRSSHTTGVAPDVLLAAGYVESELRMSSGPCVGMMQVHPRTLREMRRRIPAARRLNPRRIEDNIQLGALELASYHRGASLSHALGRYSGAGPNSGYVRRVRTVLRHLRSGDTATWQRHLQRRGPLWRA